MLYFLVLFARFFQYLLPDALKIENFFKICPNLKSLKLFKKNRKKLINGEICTIIKLQFIKLTRIIIEITPILNNSGNICKNTHVFHMNRCTFLFVPFNLEQFQVNKAHINKYDSYSNNGHGQL